jgi:hypothetical protein
VSKLIITYVFSKSVEPKDMVLSNHELSALFYAKIADLGIQFFQNQYTRFAEHCEKYCINRKLSLIEVSIFAN